MISKIQTPLAAAVAFQVIGKDLRTTSATTPARSEDWMSQQHSAVDQIAQHTPTQGWKRNEIKMNVSGTGKVSQMCEKFNS